MYIALGIMLYSTFRYQFGKADNKLHTDHISMCRQSKHPTPESNVSGTESYGGWVLRICNSIEPGRVQFPLELCSIKVVLIQK